MKMSLDLTESIVPRSDQINADDLLGGPHTYTIRDVRKGAAEQPFDFMLMETDRAYRPSKTMRRLIVAAWGPDATDYAGRRLTLYREPTIKFGGQAVGGIRISHMSHIPRRLEEKLQTARGKREAFTVDPLPNEPTPAERIASLRAEWKTADPGRRKVIEEKVTELNGLGFHHPLSGRQPTETPPVDMSDPLVQQEAEEWAAQQAQEQTK